MSYANSKDLDRPAHLRKLSTTFCVLRNILQYPVIMYAGNEDLDQTARMRRLVWDLVARRCDNGPFLRPRPSE